MTTSLLKAWEDEKPELVAVDTETTGLTFFDTPFLASFYFGAGRGYAVALDGAEGQEVCRRICAETPALVFHNAKFDIQKLRLVGLLDTGLQPRPSAVHDTEALAHLLDEHRPKGLKPLARKVLGLETDEADAIRSARRKLKLTKADGLDKVYEQEPELVTKYAIKDVEFTWALYHKLWPLLSKYDDLLSLYELEQELLWVLLDMEERGMAVDVPYTETQVKEHGSAIVKAEWAIEDATKLKVWYPDKPGRKTPEGCINPNSNDQIRAYFAEKGVHSEKFDKAVLKELEDPFAPALLELRAAAKTRSTYLLPMLSEERDGILHPNFRQHGTRGRRMSAGEAEG